MEQSAAPFGLDQWSAALCTKRLPILARTAALVRQLLDEPDVSLKQLHPIIAQDPACAAQVIGLANKLNRNPETDVTTVELAVATLGMDHLHTLLSQLPVIKLDPRSVPHKQYFHSLSNSLHAAQQAANLCRFQDPSIINETRLAALVYGVGHWALWRYAPQQMSEIKIRIYEQGMDTALAENDVLGCTIQQISEVLVREWQLSRLAEEALQHATSPDATTLETVHHYQSDPANQTEENERLVKQLLNRPFYPVKLANWLALTVVYGWQKPKAQRLIEVIADFLKLPVDQTASRLHQNCVRASRLQHLPGILSPAAMLIMLPSEQVLSYRIGSAHGSAVAPQLQPPRKVVEADPPEPAAASPLKDADLFDQVLNRLKQRPLPYKDRSQMLGDLLRAMRLGIGLQRVCVFEVSEGQMAPVTQSGFAKGDPLLHFNVSIKVPSLFKKMAFRPLAVRVHEENRSDLWVEFPSRFRDRCHQRSFVLASIFQLREPVWIIYADPAAPDLELQDTDLTHLKLLASATSRALSQAQA